MTHTPFELSRLSSYGDGDVLAEIRRVAAIIDSPVLTTKVFNKHSKVHSSTVQRRFGGWRNALDAAGLSHLYSGRSVSSKMHDQMARTMANDELLGELRRVASELATETLTTAQFNELSNVSAVAIRRRFGSWNRGLRAAGLLPTNLGRRYTEDEYFENLFAMWVHLGRQPKYGEMDYPPSKIPSGAYERRWNGWRKALLAFLGRMDVEQESSAQGIRPPPPHDETLPLKTPVPKAEDLRKTPLGLRYQVLSRDNFRCSLCGNSPAIDPQCKLHVDHITPFSKGGKTVANNLQVLCDRCNVGKGATVSE